MGQAAAILSSRIRLDGCMKHARSAAVMLGIAALTACGGPERIPPDQFDMTKQTRESETWSRHLPLIYNGLTTCLAAHPAQPAYAADVVPQNHGMILVRVVGADNTARDCSTDAEGRTSPRLASSTEANLHGTSFTPASMSEPLLRCATIEPVFHRDGKLLGWVSLPRPGCQTAGPAAQSSWRAFGNEPFWNVRITPSAIVFDRLGALPLQYPSQAPNEEGNRWTWALLAPGEGNHNRLDLTIINTPCSDSMADRRYDYRAEARFGGQQMRGCAEKIEALP